MCTRVIYTSPEGNSYTGRNMDWMESPEPQLWVLPKGVKRNGAITSSEDVEQAQWTSKYSSTIVSALEANEKGTVYKRCTSDGMNSEGLTVNLLWLTLSEYPTHAEEKNNGKKPISLSIWAQYILDLCKDVKEAITVMKDVYVQTSKVGTGGRSDTVATCHLSVGDREGNSVVFEYINGVLHIYTNVVEAHHKYFDVNLGGNEKLAIDLDVKYSIKGSTIMYFTKQQMQVMTNDPAFDRQIGSLVYWDELNSRYQIEGNPAMLPGSNASLSRFVRATYFTKEMNLIASEDETEGKKHENSLILARLAAIMNNTAQPATRYRGSLEEKIAVVKEFLGLKTINIPKEDMSVRLDLSRTQYNSFADQTKLQYFYRSGYSPFMIWVGLNDFKDKLEKLPQGKVYQLHLNKLGVFEKSDSYASGNVADYFKVVDMFEFIPAN